MLSPLSARATPTPALASCCLFCSCLCCSCSSTCCLGYRAAYPRRKQIYLARGPLFNDESLWSLILRCNGNRSPAKRETSLCCFWFIHYNIHRWLCHGLWSTASHLAFVTRCTRPVGLRYKLGQPAWRTHPPISWFAKNHTPPSIPASTHVDKSASSRTCYRFHPFPTTRYKPLLTHT